MKRSTLVVGFSVLFLGCGQIGLHHVEPTEDEVERDSGIEIAGPEFEGCAEDGICNYGCGEPDPDCAEYCQQIAAHGDCNGDFMYWCEDGELHAWDCTDEGAECGWLNGVVGHWCLPRECAPADRERSCETHLDCCPGSICVEYDGRATCNSECVHNSDCDSGCCVELEGGFGACADSSWCN